MDESKKPFAVRVQDVVYNVELGLGLRLIQGILYTLAVLLLVVGFTAKRFAGLKEPEAMDCAQLGHNLLEKHHFITQNIRPASMWYLIEKSPQHNPQMEQHPDIVNPPLYPALLALGFTAVRGSFGSDQPGTFGPEQWIVVPLGHLCTLLSGLLVYLLARQLFDHRHGFWAMTAFYLSATVWELSVSGLNISLLVLLTLGAWYCASWAVEWRADTTLARPWRWPLLLSLLCAIAAVHTRYIGGVIAPAVALYLWLAWRKEETGWRWAVGYLVLFAVALLPWLIRNIMVSGGPLGLAPYLALNDTNTFSGGSFERMLAPVLSFDRIFHALAGKWFANFGKIYDAPLRGLGDGLFICFFLTSFFFQFNRPQVNLFRWCSGAALLLYLLIAPLFGPNTLRAMAMFWPLALIYGLAFFFVLLQRMRFRLRILNQGLTGLFILLGTLPLIFDLVPSRARPPYPPYLPLFVRHVSNLLRPNELMCTDMPWATAWYGNRDSLWVPTTIDEFYAINDNTRPIRGLYFTTITRDKQYVHDLLTGPYRSWFPLLEGRIPGDFPLKQGFPLNNMDQLFFTDQTRWGG